MDAEAAAAAVLVAAVVVVAVVVDVAVAKNEMESRNFREPRKLLTKLVENIFPSFDSNRDVTVFNSF